MKKLLTLFAMLTLFVSMMAQTTPLNYQAVLRDPTTNELVRNQSVTAVVTVPLIIDNQQETLFEGTVVTNSDGMLNLPLTASNNVNWAYVREIVAEFTYEIGTQVKNIRIVTPVTPVPFAFHTDGSYLTTDHIVNYIKSGIDGTDIDTIYKTLQDNEAMYNGMRDSIVKYIKENYDKAKEIGYHYLFLITATDLNQFYHEGQTIDQAVKDSIYSMAKKFLKDNRAMLVELAKYYAETATAAEVNQLYNELLSNSTASAKIRQLLYGYFDAYLANRGLDGCNLCDIYQTIINNGAPTVVCPAWTSSIFYPILDNGYYKATLTFTGNTAATTVSGTYIFTQAGSAPGNETAISSGITVNDRTVTLNIPANSLPELTGTGDQIQFILKLTNTNSQCTAEPVCTGTYEQGQFPTVDPCAIANDFNATATISNDGLVAELSCTGNFDWTNRGFSATAYDANNLVKEMNAQLSTTTCDQGAYINPTTLGNFIPKTVVFEVYGNGENCEATTFTANVEGCPSFGESHVRYHENQIIYVIPFDARLYSDVFSANSFTITIHQSGQSDITATIIGNPVSYSPTATDHYVELTTDVLGTIEYSSATYTIDINVPNCSVQSVSGNYSELCPTFGEAPTTLCKHMDDGNIESEHSVTITTHIDNYDPSLGNVQFRITFYDGSAKQKTFNADVSADGSCTLTVTRAMWLEASVSMVPNSTTWSVLPVFNYTNTSFNPCGAGQIEGTGSGTIIYNNIPACN